MIESRRSVPRRADRAAKPDNARYHQPSARECALLVLRLLQVREDEVGREVSRARISQTTLRSLCGRSQITNDLLLETQEFLLVAGWCLFCVGPNPLRNHQEEGGWGLASDFERPYQQRARRCFAPAIRFRAA